MTGPSDGDLASDKQIDLAAVSLGYESFRLLATNPHLSAHNRIGFPDSYREGHSPAIFADICGKLPQLDGRGGTIVDIGPGCAELPHLLLDHCARQDHRVYMVDSAEMLDQLPDPPHLTKRVGAFPAIGLSALPQGGVDAVLCYSVLHYMFIDTSVFAVLDAALALLAPGGRLLLGDIPNQSKRRRFFASEAGRAYHRSFTGQDADPEVRFGRLEQGRIDDSVLLALLGRAQAAGFDAWLMPQAAELPMANRRDDLLFRRP